MAFCSLLRFIYSYAESHHAESHHTESHHAESHHADCHYAECRYAGCQYAECNYAECHGAVLRVFKNLNSKLNDRTTQLTSSLFDMRNS